MDIRVEDIIGIKVTDDKDKNYVAYEIFYRTDWDGKNYTISATIIHRDRDTLKEVGL